MAGPLTDKRVVLGVTGSIACYKALDLASKLVQAGALVDTIMTYGATQFVTPLAFRSITHRPVVTDSFDPNSEYSVEHVALGQQADVVVIAPATVHCIAKLALGLADDPLTTTVVATKAPLLVAPAMDADMYDHPATQENLAKLLNRGVVIAGPGLADWPPVWWVWAGSWKPRSCWATSPIRWAGTATWLAGRWWSAPEGLWSPSTRCG